MLKIALVGNPNAGKTSIFNRLTGLSQKVGNLPGVTVDVKSQRIKLSENKQAEIIDLPGTYSLHPKSLDENLVLDVLLNKNHRYHPDIILFVADATNLRRHLLLFAQLADLGIPVVIGLNMMDLLRAKGLTLNTNLLGKLLNVPVLATNGRTGKGLVQFKLMLAGTKLTPAQTTYQPDALATDVLTELNKIALPENLISRPYARLMVLHHHQRLSFLEPQQRQQIIALTANKENPSVSIQINETMQRFERIGLIADKVIGPLPSIRKSITHAIDKVLSHQIWGVATFLTILFLVFQSIFQWAAWPMDLIDGLFGNLAGWISNALPPGPINGLISEGVIPGIGGIAIFIPQIALLFIYISLMEESGYMARVVFLTDKIFRRFGLNGRSYIALISGAACAIPAILSTRNINNNKERLITIFVTPFISCSARLPVFIILTAFAIPEQTILGFLSSRALFMMGLYATGFVFALLTGWVLKKIMPNREPSYHIMELPDYRLPHWRNVFTNVYTQTKAFVSEAGKIIFALAIVLWVLASYGPTTAMEQAEARALQIKNEQQLTEQEYAKVLSGQKIEASYAGHFGKFIEPAIKPLGFNWKIGIALITSFAAREVFVSTLATIYSVGNEVETDGKLIDKMRADVSAEGLKIFRPAVAISLVVFYLFAMQCISTISVVYKETKSFKWPLVQLFYMTGLAYVSSFVVFQLLN